MNFLLLRGLAREVGHWHWFPEILESKVPNSRAFCLDLPGAGKNFQMKSPSEVSDIAQIIRQNWIELKATHEGRWSVIGMSLGGMIAADWCARFPSDFERMVLMNSSASNLSPFYERLRPKNYGKMLRALFSFNQEARESVVLDITTNHLEGREEVIEKFSKLAEEQPMARSNFFAQLLAARRFVAPPKIQTPCLVLGSEKDQLVSYECTKNLAQHLQAKLLTHPTAGHDISLEDPEWVSDRISEWLEKENAA